MAVKIVHGSEQYKPADVRPNGARSAEQTSENTPQAPTQISTVKAASTDAAVISLKVAQVASTTPKEAVRTIDKAEKLAKKIADNVTKDEDTAKDAHGDFGKNPPRSSLTL